MSKEIFWCPYCEYSMEYEYNHNDDISLLHGEYNEKKILQCEKCEKFLKMTFQFLLV